MRITKLFYLSLVCVVLTWAACEDDDMPTSECDYTVPDVFLSDGDCSPQLLEFFKINEEQQGIIPDLPKDCPSASPWGRTFRIEPTSDGNIDIHFYNGTRAWANIQVFGVEGCSTEFVQPLTSCIFTNDAAQIIPITDATGFTDIYVTVDLVAFEPGTNLEPYFPDDPQQGGEYIAFGAYNNSPGNNNSFSYRGISPQNELERLDFSCDGRTTQRVLIGTCNPNLSLAFWKQEIGLEESECYDSPGGMVCAMDVPPGLDPDLTGNALAKKRPRQNTDEYYVDTDFIISIPAPNGPGLQDIDFLEQNKQTEFLECLVFQLGQGSTADEGEQLVVTMIDSGIELGGNWDEVWNNHVNKTLKFAPYLDTGLYGYDFFNAKNVPDDETGHGTNTAGALIGTYKGDKPLTVVHHKIFGPDGNSTYFGAVVATWEAAKMKSDVINMSWGAYPDERPDALACAIGFAQSQGAIVVAAAGNDQENLDIRAQYPAVFSLEFENVVTVGSYLYIPGSDALEVDIVGEFSNFSPNSVTLGGYLSAKTPTYQGTDFNFLAGTSISAPLVSSQLARSLGRGQSLGSYLINNLQESGNLMDDFVLGRWQPICPTFDDF